VIAVGAREENARRAAPRSDDDPARRLAVSPRGDAITIVIAEPKE
jgi:hypothetical protein